MRIQNMLLGLGGAILAGFVLGCQQAEKTVSETPPPAPTQERVINPWSSSSDPSASYQSLGHPAGVINPWSRNPTATSPNVTSPNVTSPTATSPTATSPTATSPTATSPNVTSSVELPLPEAFAGVPRAAALSTLRGAAPVLDQ